MISIDAMVLQASRDLGATGRRDDAHLNSVLAGAAYKLGFYITPEMAQEGIQKLKLVCKRTMKRRNQMKTIAKVLLALLTITMLAGTASAEVGADMMARATDRLNLAFRQDYQERIVPILRRFVFTMENLEGRERAGTLSPADAVSLASMRETMKTVKGGRMEIAEFFDSPKGQEIQSFLEPMSKVERVEGEMGVSQR